MKIDEAKNILKQLKFPDSQQNDICAYTLLSLLNIKEGSKWKDASNDWIRIHDILDFVRRNYGKTYAENTRETIRKNALHQFRNAAIVEDNGRATNSPTYRYRITQEALTLITKFNEKDWEKEVDNFQKTHSSLKELYNNKRNLTKIPIRVNGKDLKLSAGKHNALQKAIIEEFAPRFAKNAACLYIGDSTNRDLYTNEELLKKVGISISVHDLMPDVVLYLEQKNWLYFIEAVTSVGPISPERVLQINDMTKNSEAQKIFVTAFPNFSTYKKFANQLAWETEVWIAEFPDHMIHLNGDKFLGPRN